MAKKQSTHSAGQETPVPVVVEPAPKPWYTSKTVLINGLLLLAAIVAALLEIFQSGQLEGVSVTVAVLTVVNIILRTVTKNAVSLTAPK